MLTEPVFCQQFAHYHALLPLDKNLATLQKAVINNEARYVNLIYIARVDTTDF
jgi:hypothetical protein